MHRGGRSARRSALTAVLAPGAAACSSPELDTDDDPGTDFTSYRTFSFGEGEKPRDPVARRSVEHAVPLALEDRGLENTETGGDPGIYGHLVTGEEVRIDSCGYGTYGRHGLGWGGGVTTTTVTRIPVGTLVLDLVDAKKNELVWRGVVKDEISTTAYPEEREKKAIAVAKEPFAAFRPKPKD